MHSHPSLSFLSRLTCVGILSAISACGMAQVEEVDTVSQSTSVREADKADRIAEILQRREFHLNKKASGPVERHAFCEVLFDKIKVASPEIEYPEPVVRTDDPKHPLFDKYQYCSSAEHVEKNKGGTGYFFYLREFGTKGFRVYRLDIDNDPATVPEEIIYGEASRWLNAPYSGYYTIITDSVSGCLEQRILPITIFKLGDEKVSSNINAIIRHHEIHYKYELANLNISSEDKDEYLLRINKLVPIIAQQERREEIATFCVWNTLTTE